MEREYFLKTSRLSFSKWLQTDGELAECLWGDPRVTKYICASGRFRTEEIMDRLRTEMRNELEYQVQYWPVFESGTGDLTGCCGLRPRDTDEYEFGIHLRPEYWGQGYGTEAAEAVIQYAFTVLKAKKLFAGHNPNNEKSRKLLHRLGFIYVGDEFYEPTGLYHPSYKLQSL